MKIYLNIRVRTVLIAVLGLVPLIAAAPMAHAAVERERVWADGVEMGMTVPHALFPAPANMNSHDDFYVVAPQTATHQSTETGGDPPFHHDHVVSAPGDSGFNVHWHVFIVLCSAQGLSSGNCVAVMTDIGNMTFPMVVPLAKTLNGQMLTSTDPIESPANAGLVNLIDTHIVFVCPIHPIN